MRGSAATAAGGVGRTGEMREGRRCRRPPGRYPLKIYKDIHRSSSMVLKPEVMRKNGGVVPSKVKGRQTILVACGSLTSTLLPWHGQG